MLKGRAVPFYTLLLESQTNKIIQDPYKSLGREMAWPGLLYIRLLQALLGAAGLTLKAGETVEQTVRE